MLRTNGCSEAIFGGLLRGDKPLRYIFVDEAGTSAREPVTVVVGIIANADEHVMSAEAMAYEAMGAVPPEFRDEPFHAMQVYGDKKYQDANWSLTDRLELLHAMMRIPRQIGMAVCLAVHWRGAVDFSQNLGRLGLTPAQSDHFAAFQLCLAVADRNIRKHAKPREVATVVAEDVPEMRKHLRAIPQLLRKNPYILPQEMLRRTVGDEEAGYIKQGGDIRITRIRSSVHFVDKEDDPLVQVADACAYGFRRYFAGENFGVEFVRSIVGHESVLRNFASPGGAECYWPSDDSPHF